MASPAEYKFQVKHKTSDTSAPYGGMKYLDVFATDFENALLAANTALTSSGYTVVDQESYDASVEALEDVDMSTYIVSVELKVLVTASVV